MFWCWYIIYGVFIDIYIHYWSSAFYEEKQTLWNLLQNDWFGKLNNLTGNMSESAFWHYSFSQHLSTVSPNYTNEEGNRNHRLLFLAHVNSFLILYHPLWNVLMYTAPPSGGVTNIYSPIDNIHESSKDKTFVNLKNIKDFKCWFYLMF